MTQSQTPKESTISRLLRLQRSLHRMRERAKGNYKFANRQSIHRSFEESHNVVYFRKYPPDVQECAWKHLNILCERHKDKLNGRPKYKGIMVATATRLALDELGYRRISLRGCAVANSMWSIRARLYSPIPTKSNEPCRISQGNLEGI
jgi:hypothetical protein